MSAEFRHRLYTKTRLNTETLVYRLQSSENLMKCVSKKKWKKKSEEERLDDLQHMTEIPYITITTLTLRRAQGRVDDDDSVCK